ETADPARYVPREATEQALGALEAWRREEGVGSTVVALVAAPGLGKTLLLRLFEERLRRDGAASEAGDVLYLPYAGLELPDLCAWCYGLLGRGPAPAESRDHPLAALTGLVALAGGPDRPLFLLVDDADSMPLQTARVLAQGLARERSGLRLVLALGDDARSSRLLATLDLLHPRTVALRSAMSLEETRAFLAARLRHPRAASGDEAAEGPEPSPERVERLHRLSGGVPRRVQALAAELLERPNEAIAADLERKRRRDAWLGSPIDDDL
ncbi:MAG: hypothetical protein R3E53_07720, partial [Myxococcota bacterium]